MDDQQSLHTAIWEGRTDVVLALLAAGADPNDCLAPDGRTPLMCAAGRGEVEAATALLAAGADVNRLTNHGKPAICDAAGNGSDEAIAIIHALLDAGADVNKGRWYTPLMCACSQSVAAMEALLDRGADPNAATGRGTALHVCVGWNNLEGIRLLLARGADPSLRVPSPDGSGPLSTALEAARAKQWKAMATLLEGKPLPVLSRQQLLDRLDEMAADPGYALRPGAPESEVAAFAEAFGGAFPHLLLDVYGRAAGQEWSADKPLIPHGGDDSHPGWYLIPPDEVVTDWRGLTEALDNGFFDEKRNLNHDPAVARGWWNRGWIPFLGDGGGGYVCLDLAPAARGNAGQVMLWEHDSPSRPLLARSLEEYFSVYGFG